MGVAIFLVCTVFVVIGVYYAFRLPVSGRLFWRLALLAAAEYWLIHRTFLDK